MTDRTTTAGMPFIIDETMPPDQFRIGYLPQYEALTRPGGKVFEVNSQRQENGDTLVCMTFAPDFVALRRLT